MIGRARDGREVASCDDERHRSFALAATLHEAAWRAHRGRLLGHVATDLAITVHERASCPKYGRTTDTTVTAFQWVTARNARCSTRTHDDRTHAPGCLVRGRRGALRSHHLGAQRRAFTHSASAPTGRRRGRRGASARGLPIAAGSARERKHDALAPGAGGSTTAAAWPHADSAAAGARAGDASSTDVATPADQHLLRRELTRASRRGHTRSNVSSPSFSRLQATLSPALSQTRLSAGLPWITPSGVPVKMMSPGRSVKWRET